MTKVWLATLALGLSLSGHVFAQEEASAEGETKIKIDETTDKKNKVAGDIDEEITNQKLRAESGSKSKYSLSFGLTYTGSSVDRPFTSKRPDLYGRPGTQRDSSLAVDANARYRWTKNDSLTFGTDFGVRTPFQGDVNPKRGQISVADPTLGYSRVGKLSALQSILGVSASYGTSQESLDIDKTSYAEVSWTLMRTYQNGLSLGSIFAVGNTFYSSAPGALPANQINGYGGDDRSDYELGIYPMMEYQFNDTYAFRTVARYTSWYHNYGDPYADRLLHFPGTQSMGLGVSLTRDIYLYPNVQFKWEDITLSRTNWALNTTLNVF